MRFIVTLAFLLASFEAHAAPRLLLSHVQHFHSGNGGCVERFWLEWRNSKDEITDIKIQMDLMSDGEETIPQTLTVAKLGTSVANRASEILVETAVCLSGSLTIVVTRASATISDNSVNLLESGLLRAGRIDSFPLIIGNPSQHSR